MNGVRNRNGFHALIRGARRNCNFTVGYYSGSDGIAGCCADVAAAAGAVVVVCSDDVCLETPLVVREYNQTRSSLRLAIRARPYLGRVFLRCL